jgi:hypothetical protein
LIFSQSEQKLYSPEFASTDLLINESDRIPIRWYARINVTKGGAAGKGPDPPEPPPMSTDGSAQYPNMIEELDASEVEGKTRMAFAKMQIPSNLKDSYLLSDTDFTIFDEKEENGNNENGNAINERDLMVETFDGDASIAFGLNNGDENNNASVGGGKQKVQKAGSRGRNLSRASTATSLNLDNNGDNNSSANNSIKGDSSSYSPTEKENPKQRRHKTVASISSAGKGGRGDSAKESGEDSSRSGSRSPTPERKTRTSRKSVPTPSSISSQQQQQGGPSPRVNSARGEMREKRSKGGGDVSMGEQAAKLGLYN